MNRTDSFPQSFKERVCMIPGIQSERIERLFKIGGEPFLKELLKTAKENMLKRSDEIRQALEAYQIENIRKAAHSIKSSSGNIGLENLMILARNIEEGETINSDQIDELLKKIHILKGNIESLFKKE
jgi:HPt (histidine-containing phosphotransfer) domain-containing protein